MFGKLQYCNVDADNDTHAQADKYARAACLITMNSVPEIGVAGGDKKIQFKVITNDISSVTKLSVVATWYVGGAQIEEVKLQEWKHDGSAGSGPSGRQNSGTTLDIDDVTMNAVAEIDDIELKFDFELSGASGVQTFNPSLGSVCSVSDGSGTATPTSTPSETATAPHTATATATNTSGPTQTATATGSSCDVTGAAPTFSGGDKHVRHNLTNNSGTKDLTIIGISLIWDRNYNKLKKIKFENNNIWDGTDISCCSTTNNSDWEAASRILYASTTKEIKYEFSDDDEENPILFTITFDTGCIVSYP